MTHSEDKLHFARQRLSRAVSDVQALQERGTLEEDGVAIAFSRIVILANTLATALTSSSNDRGDTDIVRGCADLLWRFGEDLSAFDNYWLSQNSQDVRE